MLNGMKRLNLVKTVFVLLLCFLTGNVLSCSQALRKFPSDTLYEYDTKSKVCGVYKITDFENLKFKHVKDLPLDQCPSVFGFKEADIAPVMDWIKDSIDYSKQHCR